jgi:DNA-binding transcriptional LysR family regulator
MDLADLAIFKAVAEEGGIVRAARKLHRVQSSVTSRIQQLEASVGSQLFLRSRQRLHLSSSGEVLLAYADRLLGLAEEAKNAVADGPPRGVLKLGALESTTASRSTPRSWPWRRAGRTSRTRPCSGSDWC